MCEEVQQASPVHCHIYFSVHCFAKLENQEMAGLSTHLANSVELEHELEAEAIRMVLMEAQYKGWDSIEIKSNSKIDFIRASHPLAQFGCREGGFHEGRTDFPVAD
ncbi:hypothetical protein ACH5RR_033959 [Cinchona calisaya]|uniref:RNase H type-1 domain-containing protein n=1 Tax=Cinchona calisaya TaxID=153742 RepID=A0ABD2Y9H0_9GENT